MNKPVLHILLSVCLSFFAVGQENLVPNGSFEEYYWCPNSEEGHFVTACKHWTMPTLGTSDYFNSCSDEYDITLDTYLFSVPQNYVGHQHARTGNGYAGLVFVQDEIDSQTNSEYIQIKLKSRLEAGKLYELIFYVNCSQLAINAEEPVCPNSIGALFTSNELNFQNYDIIPITPQFQSDLTVFFCDSSRWFEQNFTFIATGNEEFLTIGVFTPLPIIQVTDYSGNLLSNADVYFFIDDVSLTEIDYSSIIHNYIPNVFIPNGDGINDFFTFDNDLVQAKSLTILNRWGNIVFYSDSNFTWTGNLNGTQCPEGVYYYVIEISKSIRINGFLSLIR